MGVASPQGRQRRSWRRSSLQGRRSRRKSLPPVHQELRDLSKSISLELPEVQRLSLLLLSSFQFSARKLQQALEESEGFDPEVFAANGWDWSPQNPQNLGFSSQNPKFPTPQMGGDPKNLRFLGKKQRN
ncbi:kinetochore-associated protein DSN1 homolog [Passer montanus]|uniref:kinetochore-associated protein DSN1 homolog n=1 Tax=Passer montanus TaxID=9160 RepID=UPI00195FBECC|nr:kinetochore-associated protein DSN1 homolog [Passer montanus]